MSRQRVNWTMRGQFGSTLLATIYTDMPRFNHVITEHSNS